MRPIASVTLAPPIDMTVELLSPLRPESMVRRTPSPDESKPSAWMRCSSPTSR